jgi:hypothetical protein
MTTQTGVFGGSNSVAAVAALIIALSLSGCADDTGALFSKPLNVFNNNLNYTYSSLGEAKQDRPITANDLIDANGACPGYTSPAPLSPDQGSPFGGGVALGMSECEVVSRLGQPTAVDISRNPNGSRSAALTYNSGSRPGLFRFEAGRLSEMDRVEAPPSPQPEKKKTVKKKPAATTAAPQKTGDKS